MASEDLFIEVSNRAAERMAEMGLRRHQLVAAVKDPDMTYPGSLAKRYEPGRVCYQKGEIVVVVNPDDCDGVTVYQIVTVLWHSREGRD